MWLCDKAQPVTSLGGLSIRVMFALHCTDNSFTGTGDLGFCIALTAYSCICYRAARVTLSYLMTQLA